MQDHSPLVAVQNVSQTFGSAKESFSVLKDISFTISTNSFNIIFGVSGSGKSTLLNILTGLQPPSKGKVTFSGNDVYQLSADDLAHFRADRIGIVYQQNHWVQSLNVLENVALPLYFLGYPRALANDMAVIALERVNMAPYAKRTPNLLSGGEQQRIGMARAIVNDPKVIVADEPTGNLDTANGDKIMNLLHTFHADMKRTIILVTHNMEYLPLADNLLHIQDGALQTLKHSTPEGMAKELLENLHTRIATMVKTKKAERA